jgi:HEAT repeat protein
MADRQALISRAMNGDFAAVDALIREGVAALDDVMEAMSRADVSTADTLDEVARRIATPEVAGSVARFLTAEASLDAFNVAVDILARHGDPHGDLQRFVETPEALETLRGIAVRGIGRTHDPQRAPFIRKIATEVETAGDQALLVDCIEALTAVGDHSLDPKIADLLRSRKVEAKLRAAEVLPYLFFSGLLDLLRTAARHRNAEIRRHAVDAFYYLGTKTAAEELVKLTADRDARTRQNAIARVAFITGMDIDEEPVEEAKEVVSSLSEDVCHRDAEPIDLAKLAEKAKVPNLRAAIVEELRVETGQSFDFNPSRKDSDPGVVKRIGAWLATNGQFERGGCYKFGFRQDLSVLR